MEDDKPKAQPPRRASAGGMFWWGIAAGALIFAAVFHRKLFELARDAIGNVLPIVFTPGLLEVTLGVLGFGLVILVNYLLRREQADEWVELPDDEE